jgi:hypothetical protein
MEKQSLSANRNILTFLSIDSNGVKRIGHTDEAFSNIPVADKLVVLLETETSRSHGVNHFNPSGNWNAFHFSLDIVRSSLNSNQDARNSMTSDMSLMKTLVYQSKLKDASALLASICKQLVKKGVIPIKESE